MDNKKVSKYDLNKYCRILAKQYPFADKLNSQARQSAAECTWSAISRFYDNCKRKVPGKKRCDPLRVRQLLYLGRPLSWAAFPGSVRRSGVCPQDRTTLTAPSHGASGQIPARFPRYGNADQERERAPREGFPKYKKNARSVEYKSCGWKLSENRKAITFTDKNNIGKLKLKGTYDLHFYQLKDIKRVRLLRRADGYYVQFCVSVDVRIETEPTAKAIGLDVGIKYFLADSSGNTIENPQFYRKSEKQLNRANRRKSKKYISRAKPQSKNYHKARCRYARKHLRVSRQRKEYCKRVAYCVIQSNDLVAYEELNVQGMVKNRHLAKSISDVAWSTFRHWLEYFGKKYGKLTIPVAPHNTSQNCSNCGKKVTKSLSTRTHICPHCKFTEDRDVNAAKKCDSFSRNLEIGGWLASVE